MDSKQPLVSILIPTYNREKFIKECVESALHQSYKNIEVIVVDNCSNDSSWDILLSLAEKNNKLKIYRNRENLGPVKNWIECLNHADGFYGKILWSDDLIHTDFVERTVEFIESSEDLGFVYTSVEVFSDDWRNILYKTKTGIYSTKDFIEKTILETGNLPVSPGCALFRLKDIHKNLLLDIPNKLNYDFNKHAIGNDLLLFLLTANQYYKYAVIEDTLASFRAHPESITMKELPSSLRLPFYYRLAKLYFVEHNIKKVKIIKEFNKIFSNFIGDGIEIDEYKVNFLEDLYTDRKKCQMRYSKLQIFYKKLKLTIDKKGIVGTIVLILERLLLNSRSINCKNSR